MFPVNYQSCDGRLSYRKSNSEELNNPVTLNNANLNLNSGHPVRDTVHPVHLLNSCFAQIRF